jgi:hypothetical protein
MLKKTTRTDAGESFQQKLQRLRLKIASLPKSQRPHLYGLADVIARQHEQLHNRTSQSHDVD